MKPRFGLLVLAAASTLLTSPANVLAQAPSTMSYQGVLTEPGGNFVADGNYSLTFRLYSVAAGGAALWTESHGTVPVQEGGFSVILGGNGTPITLPFNVPYFLGVTVSPGTELTPRVALASSPYSLSLRLPFSGAANGTGAAFTIANSGSGAAIVADGGLDVGTPTHNGRFRLYGNGIASRVIEGFSYAGLGGAMWGMSETAVQNWVVEPDASGVGGYFSISGANGTFTVDGSVGVGGGPQVSISGPSSGATFDTNVSGNGSVALPANAIAASEVLDEPGIAQGHVLGAITIPGAAMTDMAVVSITIPAAGYIVVEADGMHGLSGNGTNSNFSAFQIDETAGGGDDGTSLLSGYAAPAPTGTKYHPVSVRRTYFKAAGTYAFRLEAQSINIGAVANYLSNRTITATYHPTSYGTVTTVVSPGEVAQFENARPIIADASGAEGIRSGGTGYVVDLRELELRAAREHAQWAEAERRLAEARAREQDDKRAAVRKGE